MAFKLFKSYSEKQIKKLREAGIIKRVGADRGGYWEITTKIYK